MGCYQTRPLKFRAPDYLTHRPRQVPVDAQLHVDYASEEER